MRGVGIIGAAAAAIGLGIAPLPAGATVYGGGAGGGKAFHDGRRYRFHPRINRWTGKAHQHQREIARRLRQAKG